MRQMKMEQLSLHYAAMQGETDIGKTRSTTPIHKAVQRGELKCLKLLLQYGANI
jgi:ankyrin repeat protein